MEETNDNKAGMTGAITDTSKALEVDDINTLKNKMVNDPDSKASGKKASKDEDDEKVNTFNMADFIPKGESRGMADNWLSAMTSWLSALATLVEVAMIEAEKASKAASQKTSPGVADTSMPPAIEGVHDRLQEPQPQPEADEEYVGLASMPEVREQMKLEPPHDSASMDAYANYLKSLNQNTVNLEQGTAAPAKDTEAPAKEDEEIMASSMSNTEV